MEWDELITVLPECIWRKSTQPGQRRRHRSFTRNLTIQLSVVSFFIITNPFQINTPESQRGKKWYNSLIKEKETNILPQTSGLEWSMRHQNGAPILSGKERTSTHFPLYIYMYPVQSPRMNGCKIPVSVWVMVAKWYGVKCVGTVCILSLTIHH